MEFMLDVDLSPLNIIGRSKCQGKTIKKQRKQMLLFGNGRLMNDSVKTDNDIFAIRKLYFHVCAFSYGNRN